MFDFESRKAMRDAFFNKDEKGGNIYSTGKMITYIISSIGAIIIVAILLNVFK